MTYVRKSGLAFLAIVLVLVVASDAAAQITHVTVPISGAQDAIVNNSQNTVYVPTSTGDVYRYDLTSKALLPTWSAIGVNLRAIDVTADGAFLYIADQSSGPTQGVIRKVNTATGAKTNLFYDISEGAGAYDIVRLNTNKMLFTNNNQFSGGGSAVRLIDLATDVITPRPADGVERETDLFRSADGRRVFMTGGNTSAGNVRVYDAPSNSYLVNANLGVPLNGINAALSPEGSLLAFQGFNRSLSLVHSNDLSLVDTITTYRSGLGFNAAGLLFMADWSTELFRIYNPATLSQIGSFPSGIDLDPFGPGNITFTAGGGTMIYQLGNAIHVYEGVPAPEPAGAIFIVGIAAIARRRRSRLSSEITARGER
jgi:hypothetical protein